jgi:V8-like Glu-specific endopeptidase
MKTFIPAILKLSFSFTLGFVPVISQAIIFGSFDARDLQPSLSGVKSSPERLSLAVALMAPNNYLQFSEDQNRASLDLIPLSEQPGLCKSGLRLLNFEKRSAIPVNCTGFLVAPNVIATAGHCLIHDGRSLKNEITPACEDFSWVFDFSEAQSKNTKLPVFRCKKVIEAHHKSTQDPISKKINFDEDWALIELSTPVSFGPLSISPNIEVQAGARLSMIGHPLGSGLLLNTGFSKQSKSEFIDTNLDLFPGNSGSPVFNQMGEVVGVAVRAYPESLIWSDSRQCHLINKCTDSGTNCTAAPELEAAGSHVQKINENMRRALRTYLSEVK